MSVGWSDAAKAVIQSNTFKHEWLAYLDIMSSGGSYGSYVQDVTDRVVKLGKITRQTSIIEKDLKLGDSTVILNNHDTYLSPNRFPSRNAVDNIWRDRDSGEASPYDCKLRIDLKIWLTADSTETKTYFKGKIKEISQIEEGDLVAAEITAVWDQLDPLDKTSTHDDGDSVMHVVT